MQTWKYMIVSLNEADFNKLGNEGWELIAIVPAKVWGFAAGDYEQKFDLT